MGWHILTVGLLSGEGWLLDLIGPKKDRGELTSLFMFLALLYWITIVVP